MTIALAVVLAAALQAAGSATAGSPEPLAIPGGEAGIGFDDLRFAPGLDRVLVPGGRAGILALVNPRTRAITAVPGFSKVAAWGGGHDQSVTSADEGDGVLFATDRTSRELVVVESQRGNVLSRVRLGGGPDYVRWVAPTREIWVTEPDAEQIEVFRLPRNTTDPAAAGAIPIPGGPESLVVDARRQRAYANLWKGRTVAIDLISRAVGGAWENGCVGSRGLALDDSRGLLFVGCGEGGATALDVAGGGRIRGRSSVGAGVDLIDFDPARSHLYVPSGKTSTLSILGVSHTGELRVLTTLPAASGSHCVVADHRGGVYVCDPKAGRLLVYRDTLPPGDR